MKTYLKGIKTIAVVFLSLVLFYCQEELFEPQDALSTESNQNMLRPGNGGGGNNGSDVVYYDVVILDTFGEDDTPTVPWETDIIKTSDKCVGSNDTTQDLVWFDDGCATVFTLLQDNASNLNLTLSSIRLGGIDKDDTKYQVIMHDDSRNKYVADFTGPDVKPFDPIRVEIMLDTSYVLNWKYKKKGIVHRDSVGTIRIGRIVMTPQ